MFIHKISTASSAGTGFATAELGMIFGIVDTSSLTSAFITGFLGAVGGIAAKLIFEFIINKIKQKNNRSESN
jgi:hypothetical protein